MFAVGDRVHLPNIGTGIVREVRNRGMYVVEIKGRAIVARGAELTPADDGKSRPTRATTLPAAPHETVNGAHSPTEIDLHGMTAAEAVAALDEFLDNAILAAHAEVRVIHGRSGGRLKAAVHQRLRALPPVRSFRLDPRNAGVTIVSL